MNEIESDIRNLSVLIDVTLDRLLDLCSDNLTMDGVIAIGSLLWIARDMSERLILDAADVHKKAMAGGAKL